MDQYKASKAFIIHQFRYFTVYFDIFIERMNNNMLSAALNITYPRDHDRIFHSVFNKSKASAAAVTYYKPIDASSYL